MVNSDTQLFCSIFLALFTVIYDKIISSVNEPTFSLFNMLNKKTILFQTTNLFNFRHCAIGK